MEPIEVFIHMLVLDWISWISGWFETSPVDAGIMLNASKGRRWGRMAAFAEFGSVEFHKSVGFCS